MLPNDTRVLVLWYRLCPRLLTRNFHLFASLEGLGFRAAEDYGSHPVTALPPEQTRRTKRSQGEVGSYEDWSARADLDGPLFRPYLFWREFSREALLATAFFGQVSAGPGYYAELSCRKAGVLSTADSHMPGHRCTRSRSVVPA
jgi:hypothetical protein